MDILIVKRMKVVLMLCICVLILNCTMFYFVDISWMRAQGDNHTTSLLKMKSLTKTTFVEYDMRDLWIDYEKRALLMNKSVLEIMNSELNNDNGQECYNILHDRYNILADDNIDQNTSFEVTRANRETSKIVDITFYQFEIDMFEIRINELKDVVDIFVVIESNRAWSDSSKNISFLNGLEFSKPDLYKNYYLTNKIIYFFMNSEDYPNYDGKKGWRGFSRSYQLDFLYTKEFLSLNITFKDNDIFVFSDIDEIIRLYPLYFFKNCGYWLSHEYFPITIKMYYYMYDFGCLLKNEKWSKAKLIRYGQIDTNSIYDRSKVCSKSRKHVRKYYNRYLDLGTESWNQFDLFGGNHKICTNVIRDGSLDYYGLQTKNGKQFTLKYEGWHLSSFYNLNLKYLDYKHKSSFSLSKHIDKEYWNDKIHKFVYCYVYQCVNFHHAIKKKSVTRKFKTFEHLKLMKKMDAPPVLKNMYLYKMYLDSKKEYKNNIININNRSINNYNLNNLKYFFPIHSYFNQTIIEKCPNITTLAAFDDK